MKGLAVSSSNHNNYLMPAINSNLEGVNLAASPLKLELPLSRNFDWMNRPVGKDKKSRWTYEKLLEGKKIEDFHINGEPITIPYGENRRPPKISIFICEVGSGHVSGAKALVQSMPDCDFQVRNVYEEILSELEFQRKISDNLSQENIANSLAKNEYNRVLNFAENFAGMLVSAKRKKIMEKIREYVRNEKPDMLISDIPLLNDVFIEIAREFNIPIRVITLDAGIYQFVRGISRENSEYFHFRMTYPYDRNEAEHALQENFIGSSYPKFLLQKIDDCTGYPVRSTFNKEISNDALDQIREEYQIQQDENIILVMMGGNTASAAFDYASLLYSLNDSELDKITAGSKRKKIRMICLCGDVNQPKNKELMDRLNSINQNNTNDRVKIFAAKGTPKIAEIESLPELKALISKPGGGTCGEAIKKQVPMLYHVAGSLLKWEEGNMKYGIKKGYGIKFNINEKKARSRFLRALESLFQMKERFQSGVISVPESNYSFQDKIRELVREDLRRCYEEKPIYDLHAPGFGFVQNEGRIKNQCTISKVAKVAMVLFAVCVVVGVSTALNAVPFSLGIALASCAGVALLVASVASIIILKKRPSVTPPIVIPMDVSYNNTRNRVKPGEATKSDIRVINDVGLTFEWKKELMFKANQSIECSFNFAGGENLREVLQIIQNRMNKKNKLTARLMLSDDLLEKGDEDLLKQIKNAYPDRFFYLVTNRKFNLKKISTNENHVKLLVVDGKYFVIGGSGVYFKMNREQVPVNSEKPNTLAGKLLDKCFRDTDIVGCGDVAEGLRAQFYNLYYKWTLLMKKKMDDNEVGCVELDKSNACQIDNFHQEENLIKGAAVKFYVSGPEHPENPIEQEYIRQIDKATNQIIVGNLLFMPTKRLKQALIEAKKRNIKTIGIFGSNQNNSSASSKALNYANQASYPYLTKIYQYNVQKQQYHKKVALFDSRVALIGSFNLGFKSAKMDDEIALSIENPEVVNAVMSGFSEDIKQSTEYDNNLKVNLIKRLFSSLYTRII